MKKLELYKLIFKSDRNHGHRITSVVVIKGKSKFITQAMVARNNSELDHKAKAQRYALTKALKGSGLDKEQRRDVWSTFFLRSKRTRKLIGA